MFLHIGEISKFKVVRETNISYIITEVHDINEREVFLHFNQATRRLEPGEVIEAFLYYDNKHRLCATMEKPFLLRDQKGFLKVVGKKEHLGVFVDNNVAKDVLVSRDDLPMNEKGWPNIGDTLPVTIKVKTDSLVGKILTKKDLPEHESKLEVGKDTQAFVSAFSSSGIICFTLDYDYIYIHKSLVRKKYRLGEELTVHIINRNEHGDWNGSLIEQKEKERLVDSDIILKYLVDFGGVLKLGNASTPEEIQRTLNMSKSAFKRAVGHLYKNRQITVDDNKITLIKE